MQDYKSSWSSGTRLVVVTVVLAVLISAFGVYKVRKKRLPPSFEKATASKLTTSGNVVAAALSADAQVIAYVTKEATRQAVFLKPVTTSNNSVELVGPTEANYHGLTFSPDARFIYFVRSTQGVSGSVFRLPLTGGSAVELLHGANSTVCLSPDGQLLAFLRAVAEQKETALVIGRADGTGERKLAVLKEAESFVVSGGPSWSPDGKLIATAVAHDNNSQNVVVVSATDGSLTSLGNTRFRQVGRVAWLADGKSLLVTARDQESSSLQVWQLTYPAGEARQLTHDASEYQQLSLSKDSRQLVALQTARDNDTGDVVLLNGNANVKQ